MHVSCFLLWLIVNSVGFIVPINFTEDLFFCCLWVEAGGGGSACLGTTDVSSICFDFNSSTN